MHRPAAVLWVVNRSHWLAGVLFLLWLLGWVAMLAFYVTQVMTLNTAVVWLLVLVLVLVSSLAWKTWIGMPQGCLQWDGRAWYWSKFQGDDPCSLTVHMDLQRLLIVSVRRSGEPPHWLWLESWSSAADWMALRRAVVASTALATAQDVVEAPESGQHAP